MEEEVILSNSATTRSDRYKARTGQEVKEEAPSPDTNKQKESEAEKHEKTQTRNSARKVTFANKNQSSEKKPA